MFTYVSGEHSSSTFGSLRTPSKQQTGLHYAILIQNANPKEEEIPQ
jgi:hypothetical protein